MNLEQKKLNYTKDFLIKNEGFFVYNEKPYLTKKELYDDYINGDVFYYFNDDIYSSLDWKTEPIQSLKEMYKERAQQLRDKYSYLILSFSGGYDSTEILYTFLENNIFLDEIQIVNWKKLSEKINLEEFKEYDLNIIHHLNYIKKVSPNTKITVIDNSEFCINDIETKQYASLNLSDYGMCSMLPFPRAPRTYILNQMIHNLKFEKKSGALIVGVDKPKLFIQKNNITFRFHETRISYDNIKPNNKIYKTLETERFFWTRDYPLIPIKQSHVIINNLIINSNLMNKFIQEHPMEFERRIVPYIYHYHNKVLFVAPKIKGYSVEFDALNKIGYKKQINDGLLESKKMYKNKLNYLIFSKSYIIKTLDLNTILPKISFFL